MKLHVNDWMRRDLSNANYSVVIANSSHDWWIIWQSNDIEIILQRLAETKADPDNRTAKKIFVVNNSGERVKI